MINKQTIINSILFALFIFGASINSSAQDGEALFKSNCALCHKVNEDGVGPALEGVHAKWEEAGEAEFLYDWVKDSQKLVVSGKSKMAFAADTIKVIPMGKQSVTNEEIDAIFEYVDSWVAPVENEEIILAPGERIPLFEAEVIEGLDADTYRSIFIWQIILLTLLLFIAVFYSTTIKKISMMKIDKLKSNNNLNILLPIIGTGIAMGISSQGHALELSMSNEHLVTATFSDNFILLIINLIMVGLVIYLKGIIVSITNSMIPEEALTKMKVKEETKKEATEEVSFASKLTGMVDMEDEKSILIDHDFDGIQELDNHLPPWWLWSFYASIVFAIGFHLVYDVFHIGPDQLGEYRTEMAEAEIAHAEYLLTAGPSFDETTVELTEDPTELENGATVFVNNCVSCHKESGQGSIGPNLTDEYWIYGNDVKEIFTTVKFGTGVKGMPPHEKSLTAEDMRDVSSYILTLPFTEGKGPEGDKQ